MSTLLKIILPVATVVGTFAIYPVYKQHWINANPNKPVSKNLLLDAVEQLKYKSEIKIFSLLTGKDVTKKMWKETKVNSDEFTLPPDLPPMLDIPSYPVAKITKIPDVASPVKTVELSPEYKVNVRSVVNATVLDKKLEGVLRGKGQVIIQAAQEYNICPIFLTAILMHESANGKSNFAEDKNNVAGIMTVAKVKQKGKWINKSVAKEFDNVEECIRFTAKLLGSKTYAGGKRDTIGEIQQVYCPVGAKNDPKKLNGHWLGGVMGYMEKLWGKTIHVRS